MELRSFSHGYGQIIYNIVLASKYRYKLFYDKHVKKDCELILNNICMEQGYRIHAMEIVEDHVHFFLEFHPRVSLSNVVQYVKGGSSYRLFKLHLELRKRYWVEAYGQKENFSIRRKCNCRYNCSLYQGISGEIESKVRVEQIKGIGTTKTR